MPTYSSPALPDQLPSAAELELIEHALPGPHQLPTVFRRRSTLTPAEIAGEVTTLGWDTNYVLQVNDVNAILATSDAMPREFAQMVDPVENYGISGSFDPWQIGLGGSGGIVLIAAPIPQGTMTSGLKSYDLSNTTAYIALKLKYVPQLGGGEPLGGNELLQIDDLIADPVDRSDFDPAVVVQNLVFPTSSTPPTAYVRALMIGALQEWFNANIEQFAYVFATVNLNELASGDSATFQWLKPTYTGYAYFDGPTEESAYLGVLCMTENRSPNGLSLQIGPGSVPDGSTAGFNISMARYMEKTILPGLINGFPNASASSFVLTDNNTVIENTADLQCDEVKVGAIYYTPYIKEFTLQVVGDEIQLYTKTVTKVSPGINSIVRCTSYQRIVLVNKPDGTQTLDFEESRPPDTDYNTDVSLGVQITEIVVGIVGAVAGIVAGTVIKGVVKIIVACVIIAIVFGLAAATPQLIAAVADGKAAELLPPIDLMVLNATSPVVWPGSAQFTLQSASINGAFQLGGNPNIVVPAT